MGDPEHAPSVRAAGQARTGTGARVRAGEAAPRPGRTRRPTGRSARATPAARDPREPRDADGCRSIVSPPGGPSMSHPAPIRRVAAVAALVAGLLVVAGLTPVLAKVFLEARLDAPIALDSPPGAILVVGATVETLTDDGRMGPVEGSPVYLRLTGRDGSTTRAAGAADRQRRALHVHDRGAGRRRPRGRDRAPRARPTCRCVWSESPLTFGPITGGDRAARAVAGGHRGRRPGARRTAGRAGPAAAAPAVPAAPSVAGAGRRATGRRLARAGRRGPRPWSSPSRRWSASGDPAPPLRARRRRRPGRLSHRERRDPPARRRGRRRGVAGRACPGRRP